MMLAKRLAFLVAIVLGAREQDRILNLPGLDTQPTFKQYSGYLNAIDGNRLFYWFVESENNPSTDPVLLWLNGGPGCSSLKGFLMEIGPFRVNNDGMTLSYFQQRWNRIANIIFLESPAGVGFSYNSQKKNYTRNDDLTAENNHAALKSFFSDFPEFSKNKFFVAGESYGGVYVPTLSARLVNDPAINFKGFAVGNPVTSSAITTNSMIFYSYFRGIIDDNLWSRLLKTCCKDQDVGECDFSTDSPTRTNCNKSVREVWESWSGINPYNYLRLCDGGVDGQIRTRENWGYPCIDTSAIEKYLSSAQVRSALHVEQGVHWGRVCSYEVTETYKQQYDDVSKFYKKVIRAGGRVMLYSGDLDLICDYIGSGQFVDALELPLVKKYKQWTYKEEDGTTQVAGFVKQFRSLKFAVVKGAGHSVPTDKPQPAFDLIQRFFQNQDF